MSSEQLVTLLDHSLDPTHAKEATTHLNQALRAHPSLVSDLFRIASETAGAQNAGSQIAGAQDPAAQIAGARAHAALLLLKNAVTQSWDPERAESHALDLGSDEVGTSGTLIIPDEVKAVIRAGIVGAACAAVRPVLEQQWVLCFGAVAKCDFPERWPGMLEEVMACVADGADPRRMLVGLRLLLQVLRSHELRLSVGSEDKVAGLVAAVFPVLLGIGNTLVERPEVEAWSILHLVAKIFYTAVSHGEIPVHFLDATVFNAWATLLARIVVAPVPEEHLRVEEGESESMTVYWKPKKWSCTAVHRLYVRYGNPEAHESMLSAKMSDQERAVRSAFSASFSATYGSQFLDMMLTHVLSASKGAYAPPRFRNVCLNFVDACLQEAGLRKIIKPRAEELMFQAIPVLLALDEEDLETFEDDPVEYVRRSFDFVEEFTSARSAAMTLWVDLCEAYAVLRNKAIEWTAQLLGAYSGAGPAPDTRAVLTAETAYHALDGLAEQLTKKNRRVIMQVVTQCALPAATVAPGVLRARVCKFLGTYADLPFEDPTVLPAITQALLTCIQPDNDLPVRVQACSGLSFVLANCEDSAKAVVRPHLKPLLHELFALMDKIDSDVLVQTLEVVSSAFEEEIGPYAVELVSKLVATFARLFQEDSDDNAAFAAQQCLGTICTILNAVQDVKDLFPQLEAALLPMLQRMVSQEGIDFFEEIMEIVTCVTYHTAHVSDAMLDLLPLMHAAFNDWGADYVEDMEAPLDNMITRATDRFVARPNYIAMVYDICKSCCSPEMPVNSAMVAANLFEPIAQACRGHADEFVRGFLPALVERLYSGRNNDGTPRILRNKHLQLIVMRAVGNAMYYNPTLSMETLAAHGSLAPVFSVWAQCIPKFRGYHARKICAIGLLSVLSLGPSSLPDEIKSGAKDMLVAAFNMVHTLAPVKAKREKLQRDQKEGKVDEAEDDDEEEDPNVDTYDVDEDPEDADRASEDVKYIRMLQRQARLALQGELDEDDDEDDSDEDDDDEEAEDLSYMAAIDSVDEHTAAKTFIENLASQSPQEYQAIIASLTEEEKAVIQAVVAAAPPAQ